MNECIVFPPLSEDLEQTVGDQGIIIDVHLSLELIPLNIQHIFFSIFRATPTS